MANPCRTPKNAGVSIKSTFKKIMAKVQESNSNCYSL